MSPEAAFDISTNRVDFSTEGLSSPELLDHSSTRPGLVADRACLYLDAELGLLTDADPVARRVADAVMCGRSIGFTRTDWTEEDAHSSVARCFDPPRAGVVGVRKIAAGVETWHILVFDSSVTAVVVTVNDLHSPVYHADVGSGPASIATKRQLRSVQ